MELLDDLGLSPEPTDDEPKAAVRYEPFLRLTSNVKGYRGDIGLGPCTAFIGDNQSGKSAKLDAIRLALLGSHKISQHTKHIFGELAPEGVETLFASLSGPSGEATYKAEQAGSTAKAEHKFRDVLDTLSGTEREHIMPLLSMRALLTGEKKTREALFRRFGTVDEIPTPEGLDAGQEAFWKKTCAAVQVEQREAAAKKKRKKAEALDDHQAPADAVDIISAMRLAFDRIKRGKNAEVRVLKEQLEKLQAELADGDTAGSELIADLEEQKTRAEIWASRQNARESYSRDQALMAQLKTEAQQLNDMSAELKQREETLSAKQSAVQAQITELRQEADGIDLTDVKARLDRVAAILHILDAMIARDVDHCPLCDRRGADPQATHAKHSDTKKSREAQYKDLTTRRSTLLQQAQTLETELAQERSALTRDTSSHNSRKASLKQRGAACKGRLDAYQEAGADEEYTGPSALEIDERLRNIRSMDAKRERLESDRVRLRQLKAESKQAKLLQGEAVELLQTLISGITTEAEAAVNNYMPEGFTAQLDLEDGNCEWQVLGADGRPHGRSMCGAEQGALIIALVQAWTEDTPLRVLALDDEDIHAFSEKNMQKLCARLEALQREGKLTQVFVATTRPNDIPDNWTKVIM
jgi:hypothetical protein